MLMCRRILLLVLALMTTTAFAQTFQMGNQTAGFGAGQVLTLTYTQNFDCIDQPSFDLDYNHVHAGSDPGEMQTPICVVGLNPTINPPGQIGNPMQTTAPLYVLVPMFSVDHDQNPNDAISCNGVVQGTLCGQQLGQTLIQLFGAIPEGFKQHPQVYTQCPDPGLAPGTCTMHASRLDLGPALAALGFIPPPTQNVFLPTPNHSHVVDNDDIQDPAIWWQVIPVLVLDQSIWPPQNGSSGLTSTAAIQQAEQNGQAVQAPSNFFLFFSTTPMAQMNHMH